MIELITIFFETKIYFRSGHSTSRRITRNFSKIGKKCPNSGQKCPDCGNLCVKIYVFSFKIQFLNREVFPCGAEFFFRVVHDCLSKCPNSKKSPLP